TLKEALPDPRLLHVPIVRLALPQMRSLSRLLSHLFPRRQDETPGPRYCGPGRTSGLERDVVIYRRATGLRALLLRLAAPLRATALAAVEHRQGRVETLQHDLGRVAVIARLVLPLARLQLALEIDLRALVQVLLGDLCQAVLEDDDAMPLRLLATLAC